MRKRLEFGTLNFVKKNKIGEVLEYLTEHVKYIGEAQAYIMRNANDFRLQRADTSPMRKSLYYKELNIYNKMPNYSNYLFAIFC